MSDISTRLRMCKLDVGYLHSITGVYTWGPVSPLNYWCLHSMSGISNRLRVSTLDVGYLHSITDVYTWFGYLQSITGVLTWCRISPLDYGCLHLISDISTRLYRCVHLMSDISTRLRIRVSTLDVAVKNEGFRDTERSDRHTLTCGHTRI